MNYNYPFLAGYLEGALKMLATDYDFLAHDFEMSLLNHAAVPPIDPCKKKMFPMLRQEVHQYCAQVEAPPIFLCLKKYI